LRNEARTPGSDCGRDEREQRAGVENETDRELWQDLSYSVLSDITPSQKATWEATAVKDWANESLAVAKQLLT
jgi:hypothetical protein